MKILIIKCKACGRLFRFGSWTETHVNAIVEGCAYRCGCGTNNQIPGVFISGDMVTIQADANDSEIMTEFLGENIHLARNQYKKIKRDARNSHIKAISDGDSFSEEKLSRVTRRKLWTSTARPRSTWAAVITAVAAVASAADEMLSLMEYLANISRRETESIQELSDKAKELERRLNEAIEQYNNQIVKKAQQDRAGVQKKRSGCQRKKRRR